MLPPPAAARSARPIPADIDDEEEADIAPAPRGPRTTPFGSVWDSQLGTPAASTAASRAPLEEEDFDEPEIPEYLIAERRGNAGRGQGGARGARGGRGAYQSAMERERYGGRGGSGGVGGGGGGINRYPDVSARTRSSVPPREERGPVRRDDRRDERPVPVRSSNEPWSDVPPELEALLRAQVASKPAPGRPTGSAPAAQAVDEADGTEAMTEAATEAPVAAAAKPRAARKPAAKATGDKAAAKPRATRKPAAASQGGGSDAGASVSVGEAEPVAKPAAKPRATRKPAAAKAAPAVEAPTAAPDGVSSGADEGQPAMAPKRRTPRKPATTEPA